MEVNGHEVKRKQIWKRRDGDLAVVISFNTFTYPICCLVYWHGTLLGKAYYSFDGKACADCDNFDLVELVSEKCVR